MKNENYSFYDVIDVYTMKELLLADEEEFPHNIAVKYKKKSRIVDVTYRELKKHVDFLGTALFKRNIKNCTGAILGDSRYEWVLSYITFLCGGITAVPLDKNLKAGEIEGIVKEAKCKVIIYDSTYIDTINELKENDLSDIIYIKMNELETLMKEGKESLIEGYSEYIYYNVQKDDIAEIIYTSGTTDKPQGVMITEENILSNAAATARLVFLGEMTYLYMPMHHVYTIISGIIVPLIERTIIFIDHNSKNFRKNIKNIQPDTIALVPSFIEEIKRIIYEELKKRDKLRYIKYKIRISLFFIRHGINLSKKLFPEVQEILGEKLKYIVCGGANIKEESSLVFRAFGIEILQGYVLSEFSGFISVNRNDYNRLGSVGQIVPGCELTISEQGEILLKGNMLMQGYYKTEIEREEIFKRDWLKTGDIGYIDRDGFLYIIDRRKDIIVLKNGETISPRELETKVLESPIVKQVQIHGEEGKIYAVIYPDFEYIKAKGIKDVDKYIRNEVKQINKNIVHYKRISKVEVTSEILDNKHDEKVNGFKILKQEWNEM